MSSSRQMLWSKWLSYISMIQNTVWLLDYNPPQQHSILTVIFLPSRRPFLISVWKEIALLDFRASSGHCACCWDGRCRHGTSEDLNDHDDIVVSDDNAGDHLFASVLCVLLWSNSETCPPPCLCLLTLSSKNNPKKNYPETCREILTAGARYLS